MTDTLSTTTLTIRAEGANGKVYYTELPMLEFAQQLDSDIVDLQVAVECPERCGATIGSASNSDGYAHWGVRNIGGATVYHRPWARQKECARNERNT